MRYKHLHRPHLFSKGGPESQGCGGQQQQQQKKIL